jgi:hypothetical protein
VDKEKRVVDAQKIDRFVGILYGSGAFQPTFSEFMDALFSMTDEERNWYFESRRIPVGGIQ